MFDNITPEERQNNTRTDPAYLRSRKKKFAHQQIQCESPLSNAQHANATPIIEAMNSTSTPESFFNSYWFGALVVVIFLIAVWLT